MSTLGEPLSAIFQTKKLQPSIRIYDLWTPLQINTSDGFHADRSIGSHLVEGGISIKPGFR